MENHVTSLECSRELWDAGLRVPSFAYWLQHKYTETKGQFSLVWPDEDQGSFNVDGFKENKIVYYPAYLASELGELLPVNTIRHYWIKEAVDGTRYYQIETDFEKIIDESECDARAKMLLHLIKSGLVDVTSLNEKV